MNRQELIDAILELTRDEPMRLWALTYVLLHADFESLGRLFDALADYDDVRHRAGQGRPAAGEAVQ